MPTLPESPKTAVINSNTDTSTQYPHSSPMVIAKTYSSPTTTYQTPILAYTPEKAGAIGSLSNPATPNGRSITPENLFPGREDSVKAKIDIIKAATIADQELPGRDTDTGSPIFPNRPLLHLTPLQQFILAQKLGQLSQDHGYFDTSTDKSELVTSSASSPKAKPGK
jgi:hypothetical protein